MTLELHQLTFLEVQHFQILQNCLKDWNVRLLKQFEYSLCKKLINVIINTNFIKQEYLRIKKEVKYTLNILYTILQTLNKKNVEFVYISYLLHYFQKVQKQKLQFVSISKSQSYSNSAELKAFLQQQGIEKYFHKKTQSYLNMYNFLEKRDFGFKNEQCMNCRQYFYANQQIQLHQRDNIILLNQKQGQKIRKIGEAICALLNSVQGGTILIQRQAYSKKRQFEQNSVLKEAINLIYPENLRSKVFKNFVPFYENPIEKKEEGIKYIIRLSVFNDQKQVSFVSDQKYGNQTFEIFEFQKGKTIQISSRDYYTYICQKYPKILKQRKRKTDHECINHQINIHYSQHLSEENKSEEDVTQYPKIKFNHLSILIVKSPKKDHLVKAFANNLKNQKCKFDYQKPFESLRKKSNQSIWFFSHSDNFEFFRNKIEKFGKLGKYSFCSIHKNLQIYHHWKKNESIFRALRHEVALKFERQFEIEKKIYRDMEGDINQKTFLKFNEYEETIFAFIYLQDYGIKSNFKSSLAFKEKS